MSAIVNGTDRNGDNNYKWIHDKEENEAIIAIQKKVKIITDTLQLIINTQKKINSNVALQKATIKRTFDSLHECLNKREQYLYNELDKISKNKNNLLKNVSKILTQQTIKSQQKINQINDISQRKQGIIKISQNIQNIDVISPNDPLINDNKINIDINKTTIIKTINEFGKVSLNDIDINPKQRNKDNRSKMDKKLTINIIINNSGSAVNESKEKEDELIWNTPRITIEMLSEFIKRLPVDHKKKIWDRHATGKYILNRNIVHTLHSLLALSIKIKDRSACAPPRHVIENKLIPYASIVKQKMNDQFGITINEFMNKLHEWIY